MTAVGTNGISRSDVERCIERRTRGLRFPPAIEAAFEAYSRNHRAAVMSSTTIPALLIYNFFLVVDYLLLPATFDVSLLVHLCVVSPVIVAAGLIVRRKPGLFTREALSAAVPATMIGQILFVYTHNAGPAAAQYQFLAVVVLVYMNVNQRPDFRFAVGTTLMMAGAYLFVLMTHDAAFATRLIGMTSMAAAAYMSLVANFRMERDARYTFLRRLHDQLKREEAEHAALRDPLTGLANRFGLSHYVAQVEAQPSKPSTSACALMLDVDHFKRYNDRYGHPAGDLCLKRIASALAANLRDERDLAVRVGGEEFLLLLSDAELADAVRLGERIRRTIEGFAIPHDGPDTEGVVTVSVGTMAGPLSTYSISELVDGADSALYIAKRKGRNRIWPPFIAGSTPTPITTASQRQHQQ